MIRFEQVRKFGAHCAKQQLAVWGISITLEDGTLAKLSKGPTRTTREPAAQGSGYVTVSRATFTAMRGSGLTIAINTRFTITASADADDIGGRWVIWSASPNPQAQQDSFIATKLK